MPLKELLLGCLAIQLDACVVILSKSPLVMADILALGWLLFAVSNEALEVGVVIPLSPPPLQGLQVAALALWADFVCGEGGSEGDEAVLGFGVDLRRGLLVVVLERPPLRRGRGAADEEQKRE
jgi:hypothetical protein